MRYAVSNSVGFVGLVNKDGSTKTECGIHVAGAEKTFDRDLWENGSVRELTSPAEVQALVASGKDAVVVVYAPWCQFCQAMEEEYARRTLVDSQHVSAMHSSEHLKDARRGYSGFRGVVALCELGVHLIAGTKSLRPLRTCLCSSSAAMRSATLSQPQ